MTQAEKFEKFKSLHKRVGAFVIPNPWNGGTARILAALGFEALATTSAGFAFAVGRMDSTATISRHEFLNNAREIVEATHLPVSADLEGGFGNSPETCAETIRQAADIGLIGGSIEDATGEADDPIYDFELAVKRIVAARQVAQQYPFVLTARAENFLHGRPDLDDTIKRLQAFAKAGADVLYAPGLPDIDAIRSVCQALDKPVNVVMGLDGPTFTVKELQAAGVKRISVGCSFARAALGGFMRAAKEVKEHGSFGYAAEAMTGSEASRYMADSKEPE